MSSIVAGKRSSRKAIRMTLPSRHRLSALILKNYLLIFRNLGYSLNVVNYLFFKAGYKNFIDIDWQRVLVFLYFLPALQAAIFNVTLGHEPWGLKMGIVNDELNPSQGRVCNYTKNCSYSMLSCRYLTFVKDNIIQVEFFL